MNQVLTLNENYSTTRRLFKSTLQEINSLLAQANQSEDKFQTTFLLPEGENRQGKGGLRTKGYFKVGGIIPQNDPLHAVANCSENVSSPLITVVTVVYNGEAFLEDTILSVINQTYDNVEYIIIDGGSTDGTLDIVRKYEHAIDYWVSESDKGIYDAMNKGIFLSTGKWINFMNAGDSFSTPDIMYNVSCHTDVDVIYGDALVLYEQRPPIVRLAGLVCRLKRGSQFFHQSAFTDTYLLKKLGFDERYKFAADFDFFFKAHLLGASFKKIDCVVCNYAAGGISDVKRVQVIREFVSIVKPNDFLKIYYANKIFMEYCKNKIKRFLNWKI
ncbi:Putative glycosyltransferase EpsE [Vibrio cholerae]|nr:putative glycosyltransferase [Vibrio cholerae]GHZ48428.1 Putative glycosyltransferase EpsE [Vibrio cholerae]